MRARAGGGLFGDRARGGPLSGYSSGACLLVIQLSGPLGPSAAPTTPLAALRLSSRSLGSTGLEFGGRVQSPTPHGVTGKRRGVDGIRWGGFRPPEGGRPTVLHWVSSSVPVSCSLRFVLVFAVLGGQCPLCPPACVCLRPTLRPPPRISLRRFYSPSSALSVSSV